MRELNSLFILTSGRLAAVNKKNGEIIWEVKLKQYLTGSVSYTIGQFTVEGDKIFIGCSGIILCVSAKDGSLVWKNELKGWGYGFVSLANVNNEAASAESYNAAVVAGTT